MLQIIVTVIKDGVESFFSILHTALPMAVLAMFLWLYQRETGMKQAWVNWWTEFRENRDFQKMFLFIFYTCIVLGITLFSRTYWERWPLKKLMGTWGLHGEDGSLYLENIENLILFFPLVFLFLLNFGKNLLQKRKLLLIRSAELSVGLSTLIEVSQFLFHKGTVQVSDLFFNVLGGILGALAYIFFEERKQNS